MVYHKGHPNVVIKKTSRWISTHKHGFYSSCDYLGCFVLVHCRPKHYVVLFVGSCVLLSALAAAPLKLDATEADKVDDTLIVPIDDPDKVADINKFEA